MQQSSPIIQNDNRQVSSAPSAETALENGLATPSFALPGSLKRLVRQPLTAQQVIQLQRTVGNQAVNRLLAARQQDKAPAAPALAPVPPPAHPYLRLYPRRRE